ncbi:MAG: NB-ARC domain-containing protein [Nostoc sp. DedSLP03]|uniref:NB-ARC domain-containing protein n=1 Tax=Nostoc sp. DedSLP03 TaxID=3075400 RepID=UPI002AD563DD|nr:NB-ARC domain-containing protein [Nostoc sp. DedSLP03]MDZ7967502.1 NB-ARC domain-containing protein [Nostoc sp. DedSLP03]
MPRITYGPQIQKRVKRLLEALLCFADGEFEDGNFKIEFDWKEADSANPKLTVQTTLVTLELPTQKDKYSGKLTKVQIREALNLLKDFLKILEDNRLQTKGVEEWHFTLKLWSRNRERNLKQFDEAWESSRPEKSKLNNPSPNLSPTGREALNFPHSLVEKGVRGLGHTSIFQAPPLPTHFVERPEYSDDLTTRLLNGSSSDSRTLVITAIHGLGSVGKSTLAAALAHNAEIQSHFCDGILWATLGQQPNVLALLSGWVQALRDYSFKPTSVEATSSHLRTLLYDKAVLLVVDDAWNTEDARAFNIGGARCQVLVTTREGHIADALAASTYSLDIMKPDQAMELLTKKLRREITGTERHSAENLAKGVGYLPLALELAAAEVACGTTWNELLADIQQEVARLTSFDRPEAEEITDEASLKRLSLTASLNLSVKRMPPEKQQHFSWLGVLPEDVNINKMMAATLWQMDKRDAAKMLQYLRNKALLLTGVPLADGMPTYRLHDLFHDLACNLLTAPSKPKRQGDLAGLGLNLADAHAGFLKKYWQKTQNGLWHTLLDDGYIHQRLVWHLEKAGQLEEIHQLLREESATGSNGWYEVREQLAQTGGYITDISRAWELAEANCNESTLPQVLSLQCRYALMIASVNSLAVDITVELLLALIKNNFWTPEQGLAYALQNPNLTEKVGSLTELANYLSPNLKEIALKKALVAARAIQNETVRGLVLSSLVDKLPDILPEALTAVQAMYDEKDRASALFILANNLPPELLSEVLAAAREIQDESNRAVALSGFVKKLPEILPEALAATRMIQDDKYNIISSLYSLTFTLPEVFSEGLETARAIQDKSIRAHALFALTYKKEVLPEALEAARAMQDGEQRADLLCALTYQLREVLPEALEAARVIQNKLKRVSTLVVLGDTFNLPEVLLEALETARAIQDESQRALALSDIAVKLPEVLPEVLALARAIQHQKYRALTFINIAVKLPEVLAEALAAARAIQDEDKRTDVLIILADKLPQILPEALKVARTIKDEFLRANALITLADKLPQVLPEALEVARTTQNQFLRAANLSALVGKLPEILPEVLAEARAIQDEFNRFFVLSILCEKMPAEFLPEVLALKWVSQNDHRVCVISILANKLPPELLLEAVAEARAIQDEYFRADALSALTSKLPELLPEALTAAQTIQNPDNRAKALCGLVDKLPELLPQALTAAQAIEDKNERAVTLSTLADKLPELLPQALAAAQAIEDKTDRAKALSILVNKLPELLPEALIAARAIQFEQIRASALSDLTSGLSQMPSVELFPLWQDTLHELSLRTRSELLGDINVLFPVIFALGGEAATVEIARAIVDVGRWWK